MIVKNYEPTIGIKNTYLQERLATDMAIAEKHGLDTSTLWEKAKAVGAGVLKVTQPIFRVMNLPSNVVAGILSPKYSVWEAVQKNINPSDVWWGEYMGDKNPGFLKRLVVDIAFDPLNYVTLGATAATRTIMTEAGTKVLTKPGFRLFQEMAEGLARSAVTTEATKVLNGSISKEVGEEIFSQAIKKTDDIFSLLALAKEAPEKILMNKTQLEMIKEGLKAVGKEVTEDNVLNVVLHGLPELWDQGGLKVFGQTVVSGKAAKDFMNNILMKSPRIQAFVKTADNIFNGLIAPLRPKISQIKDPILQDEIIKTFKQLKRYHSETIKDINVWIGNLGEDEMKSIILAIDGGTIKELPEHLRPVADNITAVMKLIAKEEQQRGILENTLDYYITHLYKDEGIRALDRLAAVDKSWIKTATRFGQSRRIPLLTMAEELGLQPNYNLGEVLYARLMAHHRAVVQQDFVKRLAGLRSIKLGDTEVIKFIDNLSLDDLKQLPEYSIAEKRLLEQGMEMTQQNIVKQIREIIPDTPLLLKNIKTIKKIAPDFADDLLKVYNGEYVKIGDVFSGLPKMTSAKQRNYLDALARLKIAKTTGSEEAIRAAAKEVMIAKAGKDAAKYFTEVKDLYIPKSVAAAYIELIENPLNDVIKREATAWLKAYDTGMSWIKKMLTIPFPGFHITNAVGNVGNSFLETGLASLNPKYHALAISMLRGQDFKVTSTLGEVWSAKRLMELSKEFGVWTSDFVQLDTMSTLGVFTKPTKGVQGVMNKLEHLASQIELEARNALFITKILQGETPSAAAAAVRRALFDYDLLSNVERAFLKRIFPFYTWRSRNFVFQLHKTLTKPGYYHTYERIVRELQAGIGEERLDESEKQYLPQYMIGRLFINYYKANNKISILDGIQTPIDDFKQMLDTPGREIISWLAPWIKVPLEGITGVNFFTTRKIAEETSGEQYKNLPDPVKRWMDFATYVDENGVEHHSVNGWKAWTWNAITSVSGFSRFVGKSGYVQALNSIYDMLAGNQPFNVRTTANLIQLLTGTRISEVDLNKLQYIYEKKQVDAFEQELERRGVLRMYTRPYEVKGTTLLQE